MEFVRVVVVIDIAESFGSWNRKSLTENVVESFD